MALSAVGILRVVKRSENRAGCCLIFNIRVAISLFTSIHCSLIHSHSQPVLTSAWSPIN